VPPAPDPGRSAGTPGLLLLTTALALAVVRGWFRLLALAAAAAGAAAWLRLRSRPRP
jgi:hypothetical protein